MYKLCFICPNLPRYIVLHRFCEQSEHVPVLLKIYRWRTFFYQAMAENVANISKYNFRCAVKMPEVKMPEVKLPEVKMPEGKNARG